MAYTDEAQISDLIGANLTNAIKHASEGPITLTQLIADADAEIDARLRQRYQTPFAALTDVPATPALIQSISRHIVAAALYARHRPDMPHSLFFRAQADKLLDGLLEGMYEIDALQQAASAQRRGFRVKHSDPYFAGVDSAGNQRTKAW